MSSVLDKALDDVIKGNRSHKRQSGTSSSRGQRSSGPSFGGIRKRPAASGSSSRLGGTFVRSVQLRGSNSGSRAPRGSVNQQWAHDLFDEEDTGNNRTVLSRLGSRGGHGQIRSGDGTELVIENLHYNVVEKDLQDLFGMVGPVEKARITFDRSGRSTGVARIKFTRNADAEKAIEKYNGVELDGQAMRIEIAAGRRNERGGDSRGPARTGGGRGRRGGRGRGGDNSRKIRSAEELDDEMDSYMKTSTDTGATERMMLD
ncbi:hypothetical protein BX666DRAFT_2126325 [Dichotomocladium elegans]|nr:hypothetical protein BX666DRAFT_2126325 [Dichotomocladium elegans]